MSRLPNAAEPLSTRTLTPAELNRAALARQLLLERVDLPIETALERVGGLQTQYAPSGYVGLWSRLAGFRRASLTEALEAGTVVQGTLMRATIHLVPARDYWRFAMGIRGPRRAWSISVNGGPTVEPELVESAATLSAALADGPCWVKDLGVAASGFLGHASSFVDLLRVPPSGTWDRRRADRLALAETWVGPVDATEAEGRAHLVRAYLGGFGPAPWRDIAAWAGVRVGDVREAAGDLGLVRYRDAAGLELLDLPDAPLPDATTPAPVRFLPWWETVLLAHGRRTGVLPEKHRTRIFDPKRPASVGAVLVGGRTIAAWHLDGDRVVVDPFEPITPRARDEVEAERVALEAFVA